MTTYGAAPRNDMQGLFQRPVKGCSLCPVIISAELLIPDDFKVIFSSSRLSREVRSLQPWLRAVNRDLG